MIWIEVNFWAFFRFVSISIKAFKSTMQVVLFTRFIKAAVRFIPLPPSYCEVWDFRTSSRESRDEVIPTQSKPLPRTPQTKGLMNGITKINKWLMNGMIMLDYTVQYLLSLTDNYRATWYRLFQSSRALRWKIIRLLI